MSMNSGLILLLSIAVAVGGLASFLGIGGGSILVPTLHLFLGYPMRAAVGTSLAVVVFTASSATLEYCRQRRVDPLIVAVLAPAAVVGALVGAWLTPFFDEQSIKAVFAAILGYASLRMMEVLPSPAGKRTFFLGPSIKRRLVDSEGEVFDYELNAATLPIVALLTGLISGFIGIGGGIVLVPAMVLMGVPVHVAIASSSASIAVSSIASSSTHALLGNVRTDHLLPLLTGVVVGAQLGSRVARKTPPRRLRRVFGVVLLLVAARMLL